jgi:hypoxanthine phosphoribosyltransferase
MVNLHPDLARIILTEEEIQARVAELAKQIDRDYQGVGKLYLVGILKGAFIFLADLSRRLTIPHSVDFMALSSYGKSTSSGAVRILMDMRDPIEGQHVLIVEDIVDSGQTLSYLYRILEERKPASLKTCAMVRKERNHEAFPVDYMGFDIPDVWVVGYGLDYADMHRTHPFVAELKPECYQKKDA